MQTKMARTDKKIMADLLTRPILWDCIVKYLDSDEENDHIKTDNRYRQNIRTVLNDLYHPVFWNYDSKKTITKEEQRKRQVDKFIKTKSELYTFTYFLQSNPQFVYLWGYLIKKIEGFEKFILKYEEFVDKVIEDINFLYQKVKCKGNGVCYCINDFLLIRLNKYNALSVELDLEKLSATLQKCSAKLYELTVLLDKTTLGVFIIEENTNLSDIAAKINAMINSGNHIYGK